MGLLTDYTWATKYDSDTLSLIKEFYEPALNCAVRYDRSTGFFSARILTLAALGIEGLIRNNGTMRLVIGCTLGEKEVEAIARGEKLREVVDRSLSNFSLFAQNIEEADALELLSWMIAHGYLEVKLALPCSPDRQPLAVQGIFHEKAGILEDKAGNRLAFNGSVNETAKGWAGNWESFHVFTDWGGTKTYVDDEERGFAKLWTNQAKRCLVIDVPTAVKAQLLSYLPPNDQKPKRLQEIQESQVSSQNTVETCSQPSSADLSDKLLTTNLDSNETVFVEKNQPLDLQEQFKQVWSLIQYGAAIPGQGDRVGEATCAITPYPHQINAFQRLYQNWPPKLLIADEVGLGKTIQAGLLIRQAWLARIAKRILILAPKAVLTQWQIELREKFNLNVPIYDGKTLTWYDCPALRVLGKPIVKPVTRQEWHREPIVITSSQLMRRVDRARELIHEAEPLDLVFLDEAHHARRQGVSGTQPKGANQLLRLMQQLKERTQGLVLLTATPMQVSPIEVWDLLNLLGLPQSWDLQNFQYFFDYASTANPSHDQLEFMARLFRTVEAQFGETPLESVQKFISGGSKLAAKKVLQALRDEATLPRKQLSSDRRRAAIAIMRSNTPVNRLISRHTRELLRRYYEAGKISSRIATRIVEDEFVSLTAAERQLYEAVEDYISSTYNNASQAEKNAVGFVMTIYRRRLASSFAALEHTLSQRVNTLKNRNFSQLELNEEDISDDELSDEPMDVEEASQLEREALQTEELRELEFLLQQVKQLPTDSKAQILSHKLRQLRPQGYQQVIVFTQYTDTMDFLRQYLVDTEHYKVMCFSGRGGEVAIGNGNWRVISRDETKRIFREGKADILLCTDAAAEGLNFQFCGALINYDMPWNPMRVEQRIGRIDRLGQVYQDIKIINLHYEDTVETDVYLTLRERIGLFSQYVGRLQPILATLPRSITNATLSGRSKQEQQRESLVSELDRSIRQAQEESSDLDAITETDLEEPLRSEPLYDLKTLDKLLQTPALLPPGIEVQLMQDGEYKFSMPGMKETLRVTTKPDYFDQHPGSTELWSLGSPLFPIVDKVINLENISQGTLFPKL
ncbi:helicase [Nostocales cyanobacterium HT-58-2]|nr:helicase [Nostocales cyanobacterium HT-58-2]